MAFKQIEKPLKSLFVLKLPKAMQNWSSILGIGYCSRTRFLSTMGIHPQNLKFILPLQIFKKFVRAYKKRTVRFNLQLEITANVKFLVSNDLYRGFRHSHKLPSRGQRTKTNARSKLKFSCAFPVVHKSSIFK